MVLIAPTLGLLSTDRNPDFLGTMKGAVHEFTDHRKSWDLRPGATRR